MPSDPRSALGDILEHIIMARHWTSGLTLEQFAADRKTFYAVTRCLEIISEATRRLPAEMIERWPDLPWRQIRNAGNVYRHQYEAVLEQNVFAVVRGDLDALQAFVMTELEPRP